MRDSLAFFSEYEYDKTIFTDIRKISIPANTVQTIVIDTKMEYDLLPLVSYNYGSGWYSNGIREMVYANGGFLPNLSIMASYKSGNITLNINNGPGSKTVTIRTSGISNG